MVFPPGEMVNLHKSTKESSSEVYIESDNGSGDDDGGTEDAVIIQQEDEDKVPAATRRSTRIREKRKTVEDSDDESTDNENTSDEEYDNTSDEASLGSLMPESTKKTLQKAMNLFKKYGEATQYGGKNDNERNATKMNRIRQNVRSLGKQPCFPQPVPKKPRLTVGEFEAQKKKEKKKKKITKNKGTTKKKTHPNTIKTCYL